MALTPVEIRNRVDRFARLCFYWVTGLALALLLVGEVILLSSNPQFGVTTTTANSSELSKSSTTTVETNGADPIDPETSTAETTAPTEQTTKTTVTPTPDNSIFGEAFKNPATRWLLEFLLAVLIGFLAGAVVQRVQLGHYGIKIGQLELAAVPPVTVEATKTVADLITVQNVNDARPLTGPDRRFWWSQEALFEDGVRDALKFQRSALESGIRELAQTYQLPSSLRLRRIVLALVDASDARLTATAGFSVLELLKLGDRLNCGAEIEEGAEGPLYRAFDGAIQLIASRVHPG